MNIPQYLALGVFSSYFLVIFGLFWLIYQSLPPPSPKQPKLKIAAFTALTIASLTHTWFYMFEYISWSFVKFESQNLHKGDIVIERISSWLLNTSLFEEAWASVCVGPLNWWWSEQLCLFTVGAWTVFLATKGPQHHVKHLWAYMLLGQLVAISVASNLFYIALLLSEPSPLPKNSRANPRLWLSVLISLLSVATSPFTNERTFLPNLLVMHALLFLPLLWTPKSPSRFSLHTSMLYLIIFVISAAIRARTVIAATVVSNDSPFTNAWNILHSHPAQSSIGWDVVWSTLSFITWTGLCSSGNSQPSNAFAIPFMFLATPLASIGITAPYVLILQSVRPFVPNTE
ncbi:uncharacterized protein LACBIDRAFT_294714 [Laccaria bicolor S238N-H82]|uniref:Predicted protein n=1 Tax=Laccaria bicolor (strain S238N-H82 / ATCC MYA-4686) TaxID=486041 RepID=B0DH00_LACBS|nr:uncharacterized protein LACBIDRAFT_294714 [Laccaria bicolor S238N-H82]EDR06360.1 predicted protein [Laccaria bicolor S238N-H82]|eukprot:XP_001883221.1 predicted protein [Laccaria bicolor S238N-H82]